VDIENWPIAKPIPYARKLSPKAIDKIAASIKEFSFRQPIVVDRDGVIIAGHTRLQAAQKLGLETVPMHVAGNLTPAQVRAYRLLDNRSHEESTWDEDLLGLELLDLKDCDIDLSLTGFDLGELERYMAGPEPVQGLTDEHLTIQSDRMSDADFRRFLQQSLLTIESRPFTGAWIETSISTMAPNW
jgi:ParB-like chromosome segregation protein Spo0J